MAEKLYQNHFKVEIDINGAMVDCTKQVAFPIKWSELLDEQLDESAITLQHAKVDVIYPLTKVKISLWNERDPERTIELDFIVTADDSERFYAPDVKEYRYNHELALIEETKLLEGIICRSQGYVNSLGRIYVEE